jgi:hypothetical protein
METTKTTRASLGGKVSRGKIHTYIDSHGAVMRKYPPIPECEPRPQWEPEPLYLPLEPPQMPDYEREKEEEEEPRVIIIPLL